MLKLPPPHHQTTPPPAHLIWSARGRYSESGRSYRATCVPPRMLSAKAVLQSRAGRKAKDRSCTRWRGRPAQRSAGSAGGRTAAKQEVEAAQAGGGGGQGWDWAQPCKCGRGRGQRSTPQLPCWAAAGALCPRVSLDGAGRDVGEAYPKGLQLHSQRVTERQQGGLGGCRGGGGGWGGGGVGGWGG
jgi:hypothetical protein